MRRSGKFGAEDRPSLSSLYVAGIAPLSFSYEPGAYCRRSIGRPIGGRKMIVDLASRDWREGKIREWLLLLLRFAITREVADRSAVQTLASELDCVGLSSSAPSFFRRTSQEVCAAVLTANRPDRRRPLKTRIYCRHRV